MGLLASSYIPASVVLTFNFRRSCSYWYELNAKDGTPKGITTENTTEADIDENGNLKLL